ncbi:DUF6371 domain-containing protein [Maribacter sp. Hel_I_7]|uniref:DUF6371 domain-containing protein n=1 Tax=Maribacter sp. Hel_I_7 TaxID=1249997 RepID=UPI00047B9781|nr:DUF6371 domain-containing protein [Maribacter sp. Hel_I_7]
MNSYKYTLDKSSKKFRCPNCTKKTLVYYVDSETGNYLSSKYGRCDRESNCGYFNQPSGNKSIIAPFQNIQTLNPSYLSEKVIESYCNKYDDNNFVNYLLEHFPEEDVIQTIEMYYIGTTDIWNGATIFWQIDNHHKIHTGKVMLYDCDTGNRVKKPFPHVNWMHKVLQIESFVLQQCLFGLHLILEHTQKNTICIVESEKTAIIMSMILPNYHWMATGSKTNLKHELLNPIKNFKIILFPDKSELLVWGDKMKSLIDLGYNLKCSSLIENTNYIDGFDLADFIMK